MALILAFGPISGAHFNPVVTLADAIEGGQSGTVALAYIAVQIVGGIAGAVIAHLMFGLSVVSISVHARPGRSLALSEAIATFGLVLVILGCSRQRASAVPYAVAAYITAAYWYTASTSFANPAVTIARSLSNTFSGIRPIDVPSFIAAQIAGGLAACLVWSWIGNGLKETEPQARTL